MQNNLNFRAKNEREIEIFQNIFKHHSWLKRVKEIFFTLHDHQYFVYIE